MMQLLPFLFQILKPESFATDDAEDANNSMSFETTISESKTYTTLPTKTKFVLSTEPDKLKQNKFLVTGGRTDTTFSYRLHKSLDDAPLVNVTDGLMRPVKDSTTLSAVDVGGADMSSININLQKSILVPLKIQVIAFSSCCMMIFSIKASLTFGVSSVLSCVPASESDSFDL